MPGQDRIVLPACLSVLGRQPSDFPALPHLLPWEERDQVGGAGLELEWSCMGAGGLQVLAEYQFPGRGDDFVEAAVPCGAGHFGSLLKIIGDAGEDAARVK